MNPFEFVFYRSDGNLFPWIYKCRIKKKFIQYVYGIEKLHVYIHIGFQFLRTKTYSRSI